MKINKFCCGLVLLLGLSVLSGCGGGGGGGVAEGGIPPGYDGATTPATIDAENAPLLAEKAVGYNDPSEFMLFRDGGGDRIDSGKPLGMARAQNIAEGAAALVRAAGSTESIPGGYSGNVVVSSEDSGNSFSGTVTYTNYADFAEADPINGTIRISGHVSESDSSITSVVEATVSDNFSAGPVSMSGTFRIYLTMDMYDYSQKITTKMVSMLYEDTSTGLKAAYTDLVFSVEMDSSLNLLTQKLDGRIYDSEKGYIDIDTTVPIVIDGYDASASQGEIIITGEGEASIKLVFEGLTVTALLETGDDELYDEGIWLL